MSELMIHIAACGCSPDLYRALYSTKVEVVTMRTFSDGNTSPKDELEEGQYHDNLPSSPAL